MIIKAILKKLSIKIYIFTTKSRIKITNKGKIKIHLPIKAN